MTVAPETRQWREHRALFRALAEHTGQWAGIPMPVEGLSVQLENRHEWREAFERVLSVPEPTSFVCSTADVDETMRIRNRWWSARRHAWVILYQRGDGPVELALDRADRNAGRRLTFALHTVAAAQAWDLEAEMVAREKLAGLIPAHTMRQYELTGSFLWSSGRSRVTYLLRRCRPTVAIAPMRRWLGDESPMGILAVLCLHPLGYYCESWAGSMVPTDDVIAHLLMIQADEHGFWRRANQHHSQSAEAGL